MIVSYTKDGDKRKLVRCYENHAQDSRVREIDTNPTLGSNNGDCLRGGQSLVMVKYEN